MLAQCNTNCSKAVAAAAALPILVRVPLCVLLPLHCRGLAAALPLLLPPLHY
jgi:hypothetical protein